MLRHTTEGSLPLAVGASPPRGTKRAGGDCMGNEMDNTSVTRNARSVRIFSRRIRSHTRAAQEGWHIGAILLGLLAAVLFILGGAEYYGFIGAAIVGAWTVGEFMVFGFVSAAGAVAVEIIAWRRR
jgi:hypothetical protein